MSSCRAMLEATFSTPPNLPDYELLRLIGRGSYGDVWLARGVTGIYRAVKIVWRDRFADPLPYEREFKGLKEFTAISLLESRQLALLHVGRHDDAGFFYYVMELADDVTTGREINPDTYIPCTLKEVRARRGRLPAREVVDLAAELARALGGMHARGLVHRDIKPSNVILVGGAPKLADIGLVANASAALTFVGTEGYVPPEGPGAPSADVFSLGKLLYELATGLDRHDYPRLPPQLHELSDSKDLLELNEVIVRACEPNPAARYVDATALLDDLLLLQAGKSVRRLRSAERRLSRALRVAALLAVIAGVAGGGAYVERRRANEELALRQKAEAERDALARRRTYSGNLASAQRALNNGDLVRAKRLLKELEPAPGQTDLRGFEWHALWHEAKGDPREEIRTSGPEITRLALSPDERFLAVHDKSDTVTIYETASRKEVRRIPEVWKLVGFSADGNWIVGGDKASTSLRWSVQDGRIDRETAASIGLPIVTLDESKVVALTSEASPRLRIWNFATRQEEPSIDLDMPAESPAWVPFIANASKDGRTLVRAWVQGVAGNARFRLTSIHLGDAPEVRHRDFGAMRPTSLGVDSRGAWAFFGAHDDPTQHAFWRSNRDGWERNAERLPKGTTKCAELGEGKANGQVAVIGRQVVWLGSTADDTGRIGHGHSAQVNELAVAARDCTVFTGAGDGSVYRWPGAGPSPRTFRGWNPLGGLTRAVFSADGRSIWVPEDGENSVLLAIATLRPLARARGMRVPLALTRTGLIGVGSSDSVLRVDASSGTLLKEIPSAGVKIRTATVSEDGRRVAALDHAGNVIAIENDRATVVATNAPPYFALALSREGSRLWAAITKERRVISLNWPAATPDWGATLAAAPSFIQLLPDNRTLAISLESGSIQFQGTATGNTLGQIETGTASPQLIAIDGGPKRMFVGGIEGQIHCLDYESKEEIHALPLGSNVLLKALVCAPGDRTIAAISMTGVVYFLRTD